MTAIVAADKHWGIGRNGALLTRIPADMQRFRELTYGKVVILGRKTLQTFPQGRPLDGRENIIMSRNTSFRVKGAQVVRSEEELFKVLSFYPEEDVYVIGGGQIYLQLLKYCTTCLVTRLDRVFDADAYFPDLDALDAWSLVEESDEQTYFDTPYTFCTYVRTQSGAG